MKLTKESHKLMSFFIKQKCLLTINQTQMKKTDEILESLYNEIMRAVSYIKSLKANVNKPFYKCKIKKITNTNKIPKPSTFDYNILPIEVRNHIDKSSISSSSLTYDFNLFNRDITIIFIVEHDEPEQLLETYNNYVDYMLVWLYIANTHSTGNCAKNLKIFVYHTTLLKELPTSNTNILNENNVNTAFTRTCPVDSEIIVFRKEEWFKVFIHETFHNFGLDFSDINLSEYNEKILNIFPVNSDVNLYEAYTECWARIINALFCSFIIMKDKNDVEEFLTNSEMFINLERIFAFFQVVKVLNFMGLSYEDLYKKTKLSENLRKTFYKENTNVLAYYVISLVLINSYQEFMLWCNINNISLFRFKRTHKNLDGFCRFIESKYKIKSILDGINCTKNVLSRIKRKPDISYLLKNMRMTICELG